MTKISGNEFDTAFHELRYQGDVAGQAIELRDDQYATKPQRLVELKIASSLFTDGTTAPNSWSLAASATQHLTTDIGCMAPCRE